MFLSLLAATLLTGAEPSAAGLADRFVRVQQALPGEQPAYAGWTRRQLESELRRLDDVRPSIAGPVTMLAVGAAVAGIDFVLVAFGGLIALLGGGGFDPGFTIGVSITAVIAVGLLVMSIILLKGLNKERAANSEQADAVKKAIERLTPATPAPVDPRQIPPPPLAPFPMQVRLTAPLIVVTLARF
jgi:hypothetical protein